MIEKVSERQTIFGIGTVVMDHVVILPSFPAEDTKSPIETSWRQIGGPTAVALSVASHYSATMPGHGKVSFCGRWGNDAAGEEVRAGLAARGLDLTSCRAGDDWATGFAHVWVDGQTGSRTIAYSRGDFPPPTEPEIRDDPNLGGCKILLLDGTFPAAALFAAQTVKAAGGQVVLDAGSRKPGMDRLLPLVDVLIASDEFCRRWFESNDVSLDRLRELGPDVAVRTRGADGVAFNAGNGASTIPATAIEAVDTNGAGDIFSGAFVFGLSCGWKIERCLTFANEAAGYACCHRGNSTWMPLP